MTLKEQRAAQLEDLKGASVVPVKYVVQILNAGFDPWKTMVFDTMEEAVRAYDKLEPVYHGGFLRRYAEVAF